MKSLTVSYVNSWMAERSYKGESVHEGTDIMAGETCNEVCILSLACRMELLPISGGWKRAGTGLELRRRMASTFIMRIWSLMQI